MLLKVDHIYGNRYQVQRILGSGGYGSVYLVFDLREQSFKVAKVAFRTRRGELNQLEWSRIGPLDRSRILSDLEAQLRSELLGRNLRSNYVVRHFGLDFDSFTTDYVDPPTQVPVLLMEYIVNALPLSQLGKLELDESLTLMARVCEGLATCHAQGIVHRDISPQNVLVYKDADGTWVPVLIDFGIAREVESGASVALGKERYAPPEVNYSADGRIVLSPAGDIWSVGIMLTHLLSGQSPFPSDIYKIKNLNRRREQLCSVTPDLKNVPEHVHDVIRRCLAADPKDRPTARALADELHGESTWVAGGFLQRQQQLEERAAEVESRRKQLEREKAHWVADHKRLTNENHRLRAEVDRLNGMIDDLKHRLDSHSFSDDGIVSTFPIIFTPSVPSNRNSATTVDVDNSHHTAPIARNVFVHDDDHRPTVVVAVGDLPPESPLDPNPPMRIETSPSGFAMVYLDGGTFEMGSPPKETGRSVDEGPTRIVSLSPFWMCQTPVTVAQYERICSVVQTGSPLPPETPIVGVTWLDAVLFCNALSKQDGLPPAYLSRGSDPVVQWDPQSTGYRLPTEAEWEYAARAGTQTPYFFGTDPRRLPDYAWFEEKWHNGAAHPVQKKQPSPWLLWDLYGNVWEWCWDYYQKNYDPKEVVDPKGPTEGRQRVSRGGSFRSGALFLRSANRRSALPGNRHGDQGFRVVRSVV